MLALIGLLLAGLLGMTALTVDLGFATVQQQRLETLAEATAVAALREEADIRYRLLLEPGVIDTLGCSSDLGPGACIDHGARTATTGMDLDSIVLGGAPPLSPDADVDLRAGTVRLTVSSCGATCWQTDIEQAAPLIFGQASMLGHAPASLRTMMQQRDQGSLLRPGTVGDITSPRTAGIPLRAGVQATTRPVTRIGHPVVDPAVDPTFEDAVVIPGRAPIALALDSWRDDFDASARTVQVNPDGTLTVSAGHMVGRQFGRTPDLQGLQVGERLPASSPDPLVPAGHQNPYIAYVPLLVALQSGDEVIAGFGFARIGVVGNTLTVERLAVPLAPGNATASPRAWTDVVAARPDVVPSLLTAHADPDNYLLRAPVLQ